jgi:hypothetical protein
VVLASFTANGAVFFAPPLYVAGPVGSDAAGAGIVFGAFGQGRLLLWGLAVLIGKGRLLPGPVVEYLVYRPAHS